MIYHVFLYAEHCGTCNGPIADKQYIEQQQRKSGICLPKDFICDEKSGSKPICIPKYQICDGINHCNPNRNKVTTKVSSDEKNCSVCPEGK